MKKTLLCVGILAALAGCSDDDTTTITNPTNHNPVANADEAFVVAGGTIEIDALKNDTDADGDNLAINSVSASGGKAEVSGNIITYTAPEASEIISNDGTEVIQYTVLDGNGGTGNSYIKVHIADNTLPPVPVDHVIAKDAEYGSSYVLSDDGHGTGIVDLKLYEHQKPYEEINGLYDYIEVKAAYGYVDNGKVTEQGPYNGYETIFYGVSSPRDEASQDGAPAVDTVLVSYYKNQYNAAGELDLPKLVDEQTITVQLLRNDKPDIPHAAAPTGTATLKNNSIEFTYENTDALSRFSTGHSLYEVRDGKPVGAPFFSTDKIQPRDSDIKLTYTPAVAAANSGDGFVWVDAYQDGKNVQSEAFKIDADALPIPRPELPADVGGALVGNDAFQVGTYAIAQLTDSDNLVIWSLFSPKLMEERHIVIDNVKGYKLSDSGDAVVYWTTENVKFPLGNFDVVKTVTVSTDLFASAVPKKADISVTSLEGFTGVPVDGFQAAISDNGLNVILSNAKFTDATGGGYGGHVENGTNTAVRDESCKSNDDDMCGGWVQVATKSGTNYVSAMHSGTVADSDGAYNGALGYDIDAGDNGFAWSDNQRVYGSIDGVDIVEETGSFTPSPVVVFESSVLATHSKDGKSHLSAYTNAAAPAPAVVDLMPIDKKQLGSNSIDARQVSKHNLDGVETTKIAIASHVDGQLNVSYVPIVRDIAAGSTKVGEPEEALNEGTSVGESQGVALLDDNRTVLATGENGEAVYSYAK